MDEFERNIFLLAVFSCLFIIFMFGFAILFFQSGGGACSCFLSTL